MESVHFSWSAGELNDGGAPRIWGHQARQILLLRERYCTEDVDRALGHAAAFGALEFRAVERILAAQCVARTLDEYVAEATARRIEQTLGQTRTKPRDLTEYDRLPLASPPPNPTTQELSPWPSETVKTDKTTAPLRTPLSSSD